MRTIEERITRAEQHKPMAGLPAGLVQLYPQLSPTLQHVFTGNADIEELQCFLRGLPDEMVYAALDMVTTFQDKKPG